VFSGSVHDVSRSMRTVMLLADDTALAAELAKMKDARERYDQAWAVLDKMAGTDAGKTLRAKMAAARDETRPLNDKVLALGQAGETPSAMAFLLKTAGPAAERWQAAIGDYMAHQEATSERHHTAALQDYAQAQWLLIGCSLAGVAAALLLGWRVTVSITGQLGSEPAEAAALAQRVAAGDLSGVVQLRAGDHDSLMAELGRMQDSLVKVVGAVRVNADSVATASAQIAQGNQDLSQRTEEQASALQQTAASMEQLGATVRHNADNARQANALALSASSIAVKGGAVVGQVVDTMKGINDSSRKIADIIGVIDSIAFQTNILALNAAVEAARAGEQGRGFAVVASEVRSLAQRSAEAAREVKTLINASVERVEQGTALVDQAGTTMQQVVSSIKQVADIMGEIDAASTEQSAGVQQVGEAVSLMDQTTQQNAALVEESAAAAESLRGQARQLVDVVAVFSLRPGEASAGSAPPRSVAHVKASAAVRPRAAALRPAAAQPKQQAKAEPATAGADADWAAF
jgi:methyl-accepting chemotaxis protein